MQHDPPRPSPGYLVVGALLVAGGAMLFASKGIIAKRLYAMDVGFEALTAIRAAIAMPFF